MTSLIFHVLAWPTLAVALLMWGFAPGALLRLIVLAYHRDDPRRQELLGELQAVPRIERPFWVAEQLEVALFEGLRRRFARRMPDDLAGVHESMGYRGPTACAAAGITYRQLDYWARAELVEPSLRGTGGEPVRLYSFQDILMLKIIKRLIDTGISLSHIRPVIAYLRSRALKELPALMVMSDGVNIYPSPEPGEAAELLATGRGVFGITPGGIWAEVDSALMELPGERHSRSAI